MWITHESRAACGQLENHPAPLRGRPRTDPPGPRRRADRCARAPQRATSDGYARGSPSGTSHRSRRGRRPGCQDPGLGHWARRRGPPALLALLRRRALLAPTRVVDNLHGISAPTRVISPSRCQQPPHNVDNPLAVSTTRARAGRARAPRARNPPTPNNALPCGTRHRPASPLGKSPGLVPLPPPVTHTRTPIYETSDAHNGLIPPLCATPCFLIPSLVCDREERADNERAPRPVNPRPRQSQPRPRV